MDQNNGLLSAFKGAAHLALGLILVQAVLAGLFISDEASGAKSAHEMVGNLLFVVVIAELILAYLVRSSIRYSLLSWVVLLAILTFVQLGLGMASEDQSVAEAIHVPLGVALFGLAALISTLVVLGDAPAER